MPKQYRWALKRDLDRAIGFLERIQTHLAKVGYQYKERYPDIFDSYCEAVAMSDKLKQVIVALRDQI